MGGGGGGYNQLLSSVTWWLGQVIVIDLEPSQNMENNSLIQCRSVVTY